jgi:prevent-host-death family protein
MNKRIVSATEFKARCLAFLDEVEQQGGSLTITRRGRPVAVLGPAKANAWKSPGDSWAKKGRIVGDIVNVDTSDLWNVVRGNVARED